MQTGLHSMSFRILSVTCLGLLLVACAPPQSLQPASGGPAIAGDGTCKVEGLGWAIGQEATEAVMARVWRESGSGLIRPIAPGQAVTRDYRRDRINVHIDGDNAITGIDCG
jgi:hypothetical protein